MPNRILHERICTSETLAELTPAEEVFYYRLLVQCDDYGRFDGRPMVLRARCFPLQLDRVSDADVATWLQTLARVGLIGLYVVDGHAYLHVCTWDRYQQTRAKTSKYPPPPASDSTCNHVQADASNGLHMSPYSYSESNTNTEPEYPPTPRAEAEAAADAAVVARASPKPNRQAEVVEAIEAEHVPLTFTPRDGAAVKKCAAAPAKIAAAYIGAYRREWGTDWLRENLSVHEVINRLAGYEPERARAPTGRGYRALSNQGEWDRLPPGVPLNEGFETDDAPSG